MTVKGGVLEKRKPAGARKHGLQSRNLDSPGTGRRKLYKTSGFTSQGLWDLK